MKGTHLRFYVSESKRHEGVLVYEWLLDQARKLEIHGGSAFRAIAGYGRDGVLHEEHFFELGGRLTIEVSFMVSDQQAERLLEVVKQQNIKAFYITAPAEYGFLGE